MENPFIPIINRLDNIERLLIERNHPPVKKQVDQWLTIDQLIEYLPDKPTQTTIYRKLANNELPGRKHGKKWIFLKSEIDKYLMKLSKNHSMEEIDQLADEALIKS